MMLYPHMWVLRHILHSATFAVFTYSMFLLPAIFLVYYTTECWWWCGGLWRFWYQWYPQSSGAAYSRCNRYRRCELVSHHSQRLHSRLQPSIRQHHSGERTGNNIGCNDNDWIYYGIYNVRCLFCCLCTCCLLCIFHLLLTGPDGPHIMLMGIRDFSVNGLSCCFYWF